MGPPKRWSSLRVAYHSACSMQHGQRIVDEPRKLLRNAGFTVRRGPGGTSVLRLGRHLQHPAAGRSPRDLRDRKVANIKSVRPDVVATGNIGCITQLAGGMDIPIAHTVELLDWAYGGPVPRGLEALATPRARRARGPARVGPHVATVPHLSSRSCAKRNIRDPRAAEAAAELGALGPGSRANAHGRDDNSV